MKTILIGITKGSPEEVYLDKHIINNSGIVESFGQVHNDSPSLSWCAPLNDFIRSRSRHYSNTFKTQYYSDKVWYDVISLFECAYKLKACIGVYTSGNYPEVSAMMIAQLNNDLAQTLDKVWDLLITARYEP